jgi:hypothetical protein
MPCELLDAVKSMQHLLTSGIGNQMNPESRTMLPKQAFTGFASRYSPPTLEEGFVDITRVDFEVRCRSISSRVQAAIKCMVLSVSSKGRISSALLSPITSLRIAVQLCNYVCI